MSSKNQPQKLSDSELKTIEQRSKQVEGQLAKINRLEQSLEIQDEDRELTKIASKLDENIEKTKTALATASKTISTKMGKMPDFDKIMTEEQYENQLSFVLKH